MLLLLNSKSQIILAESVISYSLCLHLSVLLSPPSNSPNLISFCPMSTGNDLRVLVENTRIVIDLRQVLILLVGDEFREDNNGFLVDLLVEGRRLACQWLAVQTIPRCNCS